MKLTKEEVNLIVDGMFRGLHLEPSKLSDNMYWKMRISLLKKVDEGLRQLHISPGPKYWEGSMDERAQMALDHVINRDASNDVKVEAYELDRQAFCPHIPADRWASMTYEQRMMHHGKMTLPEMIKEIEKHGHNYFGA